MADVSQQHVDNLQQRHSNSANAVLLEPGQQYWPCDPLMESACWAVIAAVQEPNSGGQGHEACGVDWVLSSKSGLHSAAVAAMQCMCLLVHHVLLLLLLFYYVSPHACLPHPCRSMRSCCVDLNSPKMLLLLLLMMMMMLSHAL
jgi:hypothetical protein